MPANPEGVYQDGHGKWYVKVTVGRDPLTGRGAQVTKRGFRTACEAGRARRELLDQVPRRQLPGYLSGLLYSASASGGPLTMTSSCARAPARSGTRPAP